MTRRRVCTSLFAVAVAAGAVGPLASPAVAVPPEGAVAGWPRQLGSAALDSVRATAVGSSGDVFMGGQTFAVLPGNASVGGADAFVARYDKYGTLLWVRQFGTSASDGVLGIAVSGSTIYVAGYTSGTFPGEVSTGNSDVFVARYDRNGAQIWVDQFGTALNDAANEVAVSGSTAYVTGYTDGSLPGNTSVGEQDAFVARYSKSGSRAWIAQFGSSSTDQAFGVTVSGGALYLGGITYGTLPGNASAGNGDAFVARFTPSGTQSWIKQFGTGLTDNIAGVAVSGNDVFLTGTTLGAFPGNASAGSYDGFVARYTKSGTPVWVEQFGTSGTDVANGVAASGGSIYVTGTTSAAFPQFTNVGGDDAFLVKYDTSSTQTWARQFGTTGNDRAEALALRSSNSYGGAVVVAGNTDATMWGQVSAGGFDGFVTTLLK